MADFSENYQKAVSEIKNKVTNPDELKFVEEKIAEISMMFMDVIDKMTETNDKKIAEIEKRQNTMEGKLNILKDNVGGILSDIYEEEGFDFEIVCPYCNHNFVIDIDTDCNSQEIKCPECHNVIQLDWDPDEEDDDEPCEGHCSSCGHDCGSNVLQYPNMHQNLDDDDNDDGEFDYEDNDDNDNDDDDDM